MARCIDILTCSDRGSCGCCLPKSVGDARRLRWVGILVGIIALVFFLLGLFLPTTIDNAFVRALENSAIIEPNNVAFNTFKDNKEYPMKLETYVYNIENPDGILSGEQPRLTEIGPFVYWVYRTALNDTFNGDKTELSWLYYERYIFDPALSVADDQTTFITQSNVPFIGAAHSLLDQDMGMQLRVAWLVMFSDAWKTETDALFTTRPVREILFGYDDPFLATLNSFAPDAVSPHYDGLMMNYTSVEDAKKRLLFTDTISTGKGDRTKARHYTSYRGSKTVLTQDRAGCPWSKDVTVDQCQVRGIDGAAINPITTEYYPTTDDLHYELWYPSLSRHMHMVLEKEFTSNRLHFYRFGFDPKEWKSGAEEPYNALYNQEVTGVFNISAAVGTAPITCHRPRMMGIESEAWVNTTSIEYIDDGKTQDDFETFFDIEERTGATLRFGSSSEMTVDLKHMAWLYPGEDGMMEESIFEGITFAEKLHVPVFWGNQTGGLDDAGLAALGATYNAVDKTINVLPIIFFILAALLAILAVFFVLRGIRYQEMLRTQGSTLYESTHDGDLPEDFYQNSNHHQHHASAKYGETLDALDLDPLYSDQYAAKGAPAQSAYLGTAQQTNMPHRSVSQVSTTQGKNYGRVSSNMPLTQNNKNGKYNQYGGVEMKNPYE